MRIKDIMTANPTTIQPDASVLDAQRIMKKKNIRRLPVVEHGKLVGIITKHDLMEVAPSSRSVKVGDTMTRDPLTVTSHTPFEDALRMGQEKKIGSFPVVDDGKLVGITTESDIIRFLIHALGIHEEGSRITIKGSKEKWGWLEKIISIADQHKLIILSMIVVPRLKEGDWMIALRLNTKDPKTIIQDLKKEGYHVTWAVASIKAEW
jgi:acetoin utilization protein AcuB